MSRNEIVNINLSKKPEWYMEKINPLGKVPAIQKDDKILYESAVCCDYLDQVYPNNKLTPDDPYQQAKDRILVEHFGQVKIAQRCRNLQTNENDPYHLALRLVLSRYLLSIY